MERMRLNKEEKTLLRILQSGDKRNDLCMDNKGYYLAARSLSRKGLVDAAFNYDEVEDIKLSYEGKAYIACNPSLSNPMNWDRVIMVATLIATILGIIVGCIVIMK